MKTFLMMTLLCAASMLAAQSMSPQLLSSSGYHQAEGEYSMTWSLGEMVIHTVTSGDGGHKLTQGFQQPDDVLLISTTTVESDYQLSVFPNPTTHMLTLQTDATTSLHIHLFDAVGRLLMHDVMNNPQHELDVSSLASGTYFLRLSDTNGTIHFTSKITKL